MCRKQNRITCSYLPGTLSNIASMGECKDSQVKLLLSESILLKTSPRVRINKEKQLVSLHVAIISFKRHSVRKGTVFDSKMIRML